MSATRAAAHPRDLVWPADDLADACGDLLAEAKAADPIPLVAVAALEEAHGLLVKAANALAGRR